MQLFLIAASFKPSANSFLQADISFSLAESHFPLADRCLPLENECLACNSCRNSFPLAERSLPLSDSLFLTADPSSSPLASADSSLSLASSSRRLFSPVFTRIKKRLDTAATTSAAIMTSSSAMATRPPIWTAAMSSPVAANWARNSRPRRKKPNIIGVVFGPNFIF